MHAIDDYALPHRRLSPLAPLGAQWIFGRPALYGLPTHLPFLQLGETLYHQPHEPRAIDAPAPSVLRATWRASLEEAEFRRLRAEHLRHIVESQVGCRNISPPDDAEPGFLRFPFLIERPIPAGAVARAARLGIMPSYPKALPDLEGFSHSVRNRESSFSGARYLAAHLWTAPVHSLVTERDMLHIEDWFATALTE